MTLPEPQRAGARVVILEARQRLLELRKGSNGMVCIRVVPGEAEVDTRGYHESFISIILRARALRAEGPQPPEVNRRLESDQSYDVALGGRFLMRRPVAGGLASVEVALNWIADVRARLDRDR